MEIIFLAMIFCPICFVLTSFLHELGHAFFGVVRGGEFICIIVGPVKYGKSEKRNEYHFEINKNIQYYGGVVAVAPPKVDVSPKDYFYYVLGGPLASLLWGGVTLPFVFLTFKNVPLGVWFFILQFCLSSFVIAVMTLIPYPQRITNFLYSDGKRLLDYVKGESLDYYSWKNAASPSSVNRVECEILKQSNDPVYQFFGSYYLLKNAESKQGEEYFLQQAFLRLTEKQKQELLLDEEIKQWINESMS